MFFRDLPASSAMSQRLWYRNWSLVDGVGPVGTAYLDRLGISDQLRDVRRFVVAEMRIGVWLARRGGLV